MLSFRNYISVVQSMGRAKRAGEKTKDTGQDELLHIAFMVFITFDLFYTGFLFLLAGVTGRWDAKRSIDTPPFLTSYLLLVPG
jgi:hypothetical protein